MSSASDDYLERICDIEYAIEALNAQDILGYAKTFPRTVSGDAQWRVLNDGNLGVGKNKMNVLFIVYSVHSPDLEPRKFNSDKKSLDGIISPLRYNKFLKIANSYGFSGINGINIDWLITDLKNNAVSGKFVYDKTGYIYDSMRRRKGYTRNTISSIGTHGRDGIMAMDLLIEAVHSFASRRPDVLLYAYSAHYRDLAMIINEPVIIEGYLEWIYIYKRSYNVYS